MMTVDECIRFVCEVKGIKGGEIEFQTEFLKKTLGLQDFSNI